MKPSRVVFIGLAFFGVLLLVLFALLADDGSGSKDSTTSAQGAAGAATQSSPQDSAPSGEAEPAGEGNPEPLCPTGGPTQKALAVPGGGAAGFTVESVDIVWDPTVQLVHISLDDEPGFGLNVWLGQLVSGNGESECVFPILDATYGTHRKWSGTPEEMGVHTYIMDESAADCTPVLRASSVTRTALTGKAECLHMIEVDVFGNVIGTTVEINWEFTAVER